MRAFMPPGVSWRESLPRDAVAGLTTAAVVLPKAMAYATIAGLPVQVGLYTAVVPMVVYALLGTSRPLSVSTTTTLAILTAAELGKVAPDGAPERLIAGAATLAVLTGLFLLLAGLLRLGFLAKFISEPVLVGFKAGIGLVIVVDQLPKFLGVHIEKGGWLHNLLATVGQLPNVSTPTLVIAVVTVGLLVGLERFVPKSPAPLIAVGVAIAISAWLGLEASGVAVVGAIPPGLPRFVPPDLSLARLLWPGALGIALMSFTESIAAGRAFAIQGEPRPQPNRELVATGAANLAGGFFGGMPAGGGTSQTAVNRHAGARTQMAGLVTATVGVATLLFLAPVLALMPMAALAAVVIVTSLPLISLPSFRRILRFRVVEFSWAVAACAGVIALGTLNGILVAVVLSMVALFYLGNNPPVYAMARKPGTDVFRPVSDEHPEDETVPGLLILRTDGRVHFANIENIGDKIWPLIYEARPRVVLLDCSGIASFEYTALLMFADGEKRLRAEGMELWLADLSPEALTQIQRTALGKLLGRERMHFTLANAVEAFQATGSRGGTAPAPRV
jgi:high affinity sulfate transporter 1